MTQGNYKYKDIPPEEYVTMSRDRLYYRARQIVDMVTQQFEKNGGDPYNDSQMIILVGIRGEVEKYLKAKNKGDVTPERIDKLVNTIYKNLMKKPNTRLDVGWVEEVVFEQEPSELPRGVNGSYFRMQMVKGALCETSLNFNGQIKN